MGIMKFLADRIAPGDEGARQIAQIFDPAVNFAMGAAAIPAAVGMAAKAAVTSISGQVAGGIPISESAYFTAAIPPALPANAPILVSRQGVETEMGRNA